MSVKMEDVAQLAGVSTATVSRVLNNPELVSADTRERVEQAINQLDYRVNLAARNLRTNQTRTIAIVIPTISEPVINQVVEAVEDAAINAQYSLLMCSTRGDVKREQAYIRLLTQQTLVDGILYVSPRAAPDDVRRLLEGNAPVVLCNYSVEGRTCQACCLTMCARSTKPRTICSRWATRVSRCSISPRRITNLRGCVTPGLRKPSSMPD
ncbi:MAG: LacI family transcriptional regulator [Anaerolineae bacterium]|nr:LacI family transcriptional regulator [Anaerolineae bacterium]